MKIMELLRNRVVGKPEVDRLLERELQNLEAAAAELSAAAAYMRWEQNGKA